MHSFLRGFACLTAHSPSSTFLIDKKGHLFFLYLGRPSDQASARRDAPRRAADRAWRCCWWSEVGPKADREVRMIELSPMVRGLSYLFLVSTMLSIGLEVTGRQVLDVFRNWSL